MHYWPRQKEKKMQLSGVFLFSLRPGNRSYRRDRLLGSFYLSLQLVFKIKRGYINFIKKTPYNIIYLRKNDRLRRIQITYVVYYK